MIKFISKEIMFNKISYILLNNIPLIRKIVIRSVKKYRIVKYYHKKNYNIFIRIILRLFWGYYAEIADKNISRQIFHDINLESQSTALEYAEFYYKQNNIFELYEKNWFVSNLSFKEANPIFDKTNEYIKKQKCDPKDIYLIQIGSCSGRDIEFLKFHNPDINYISTDISDEFLNFQKSKFNDKDINYYKCYADQIDECIKHYKIEKKKLIIFANGSIHLITPSFIKIFFEKISKYNDLTIFSLQTVNKFFLKNKNKNEYYKCGNNFLFTYKYSVIAKEFNFHVHEDRIVDLWKNSENKNKATVKNLFIATSQKS